MSVVYWITYAAVGAALGCAFIPIRKRYEFDAPALTYWSSWIAVWPLILAYGIEKGLSRYRIAWLQYRAEKQDKQP